MSNTSWSSREQLGTRGLILKSLMRQISQSLRRLSATSILPVGDSSCREIRDAVRAGHHEESHGGTHIHGWRRMLISRAGALGLSNAMKEANNGGGAGLHTRLRSSGLPRSARWRRSELRSAASRISNRDQRTGHCLRFRKSPKLLGSRAGCKDRAGDRFANRVAWAHVYLKKAGLLDSPSRGCLPNCRPPEERAGDAAACA